MILEEKDGQIHSYQQVFFSNPSEPIKPRYDDDDDDDDDDDVFSLIINIVINYDHWLSLIDL